MTSVASESEDCFSEEVDMESLSSSDIAELDALRKLRPADLEKMSNLDLRSKMILLSYYVDTIEPFDLHLSHIQMFCQVILNTRAIADTMK